MTKIPRTAFLWFRSDNRKSALQNPKWVGVVAIGVAFTMAGAVAQAQQPTKVPRIGYLAVNSLSDNAARIDAFRQGLRELGYVEGKNIIIEWRSAEGKPDRLPALAAELVSLEVDVLVSYGPTPTRAAKKATTKVPIVMSFDSDPVGTGVVASLARPGGNITGFSNLSSDIGTKQLELLRGMAPRLSHVAVLVNPVNPALSSFLKNVQSAALGSRVKVTSVEVRSAQEIEDAFPMMTQAKVDAVIVATDALLIQHYRKVAELAAMNRLPSSSTIREYAEAGGLISYGPNLAEQFRRAATYVDKIFKGAKPGDLPVEQITTFELFINGRTAKTLGLGIPQSLLLRADRVFE